MITSQQFEPKTSRVRAASSIRGCEKAANSRLHALAIVPALFVAALFFSPISRAQSSSDETKGVTVGDYNIHQSIEAGYRGNWINGNQFTYDTFIDLGQGLRLFDYSVEMRSLDHRGFLFDNLSFSNFGYGGDPNDVTRLRIEKNKWYDFLSSSAAIRTYGTGPCSPIP